MSTPSTTPKIPYTRTNTVNVMMTQVELRVDTPFFVNMRPWTIHGWRPFSVSNQPAVFIRNGAIANQVAKNWNQRALQAVTHAAMATFMRRRVPKNRVRRRTCGSPERYQMVCKMATKKPNPMVTGTNRK